MAKVVRVGTLEPEKSQKLVSRRLPRRLSLIPLKFERQNRCTDPSLLRKNSSPTIFVFQGMVNVVTFADVSHDGVNDVVVGWEDGTVSVLGFDVSPDVPQCQFTANLSESVSAIQCGRVNNSEYDEIVCLGFAGKVFSYTNEPLNTRDSTDTRGRTRATINNENNIRSMQKDLQAMEDEISKKKSTLSSTKNGDERNVLVQTFEAKTAFALDESEAAYLINIEIPLEMSLVLLTSSVSVDLLDSDTSSVSSLVERSRQHCFSLRQSYIASARGPSLM